MYSSAARAGLGVNMTCDPFGNEGLSPADPQYDPNLQYDDVTGCWIRVDDSGYGGGNGPDITLVPTVINTYGSPVPVPTAIAPARVDTTIVPQTLPTLTATVSALPATHAFDLTSALVVGVALYGSYVVLEGLVKSRRRGR